MFRFNIQSLIAPSEAIYCSRNTGEYPEKTMQGRGYTARGGTGIWDLLLTVEIIISLQAKESKEGTQCQQAILILSDGSASYEEEIFKTYNADKKVISCVMIQ